MTALDQLPSTESSAPGRDTRERADAADGRPVKGDAGEQIPVRTAKTGRLTPGRAAGLSCLLLGLLVVGFFAYLFAFSGVSMERQQANLRKTLSRQLADATVPVGPTQAGSPVAALDIPALGIASMVVVEGTSSRDLMSGPGHMPSSVLPGEVGTSVIVGKRSTFGAPFADLGTLKVGDKIRVTTGLGVATYSVSSFGYSGKLPPANSSNRLLLSTARSLTWSPDWIAVSADLTSTPVSGGGARPALTADQRLGHRAVDDSIIALAGWSQLLLLVAVVGTIGLTRWPRWPVILCLGPVLLAVLWSLYENAAGLLPNTL